MRIARVFLSLLLYSLLPIASRPSSNPPFSTEAECKARLNKETLQSYENTFYFLNSVPTSVCLQSQQTAIKLNVTGFQIEEGKKWSYLGALKQIVNPIKQPTQEKLLGPVQSTTQLPRWRTKRWGNIKPLRSLGKGWRQKCSEQFRASRAMITKLSAWPGLIQGTWKQERSFLLIRYGTKKCEGKIHFFLTSF